MPQNPVVFCDLGMALKQKGDLDGAIAAFRSALKSKPDFERAKYNLGIALRLQGQSVEAAAEMREIRRLHQSRVQLAQSKKMILDGLNLLKEQQPREALQVISAIRRS